MNDCFFFVRAEDHTFGEFRAQRSTKQKKKNTSRCVSVCAFRELTLKQAHLLFKCDMKAWRVGGLRTESISLRSA